MDSVRLGHGIVTEKFLAMHKLWSGDKNLMCYKCRLLMMRGVSNYFFMYIKLGGRGNTRGGGGGGYSDIFIHP